MDITGFLFDSVYQVVTWVVIALAVGAVWYFASKDNWRGVLWSACALLCSTAIMLTILADRYFFQSDGAASGRPVSEPATSAPQQDPPRTNESRPLRGLLRPANEPTPANTCGSEIKRGYYSVAFGSVAFTTPTPYQCLLKFDDDEVLWFEKTSDGMYVNAIIENVRGEVVARLTKNAVLVEPESGYYAEMPDPHTLFILSPDNQKVFYVRYYNPAFMKVLGTFYHQGFGPYIIEEGKRPPGLLLDNFCLELKGGGAVIVYDTSNLRKAKEHTKPSAKL